MSVSCLKVVLEWYWDAGSRVHGGFRGNRVVLVAGAFQPHRRRVGAL